MLERVSKKGNPPTKLVGILTGAATMENSMEVPQKTKSRLAIYLAVPLLGIYPVKTIIQKDTRTLMFLAALCTIAKKWKQPKCPSRDEWIKRRYIYTMEYYSAIKQNETMPSAATWMDQEIFILSEVSQKEKETNTI